MPAVRPTKNGDGCNPPFVASVATTQVARPRLPFNQTRQEPFARGKDLLQTQKLHIGWASPRSHWGARVAVLA
jgi:hypothetical protein